MGNIDEYKGDVKMFVDYFNFKKRLSIPNDLYQLNEIATLYQGIINENDDETIKKYLFWEYQLLNIEENVMLISDNKKRFNEDVIRDNFDERYQFYKECYEESNNLRQKIRYLDFLIDNQNDLNKEELAIKLIEDIEQFITVSKGINDDMFSVTSRYIDLIIRNNINNRVDKAKELLLNNINYCIDSKQYKSVISLGALLRFLLFNNQDSKINKEMINDIVNLLNNTKEYFIDNHKFEEHRLCINELIEWNKIDDNKDSIDSLLIEYGETFVIQADSKVIKTMKPNYQKAINLERAMIHYFEIGHKERAEYLKLRVRQAINEIEYGNKELDTSFMDKTYELFKNEDSSYSFKLLKKSKHFIPVVKDIKQQAKELGIEDVNNQYETNLEITYGVFLNYIWDRLLEDGLTEEIVLDEIILWPYMPQDKAIVIEQGFRQFFKGDYISTINILVPHFEGLFRQFISAGSYQNEEDKTFREFLQDDFVREHVDNDYLYLIDFVFLNDKGYNVSTHVSNGTTPVYTYNKHFALMIIYIYCVLASYKWKEK